MNEANLTRRFFAGLIDYTIILTISYLIAEEYGQPIEEGYRLKGVAALLPILVWMLFTIALEQVTGATLGNGLLRLKPLDADKKIKPTLSQSFKRHLLDPLDMFPFGLVAIISIKKTEKCQRLGDLWANTVVVKEI